MILKLSPSEWRIWLTVVSAATIAILTAYVLVQQEARLSANDERKVLAQTIRYELDQKMSVTQVMPKVQSALGKDLIPFAIIVDGDHNVLASSGMLDGMVVLPPLGTFDYTREHGTDNFTWQPKSKVRLATHMETYTKDGNTLYIITGKSMAEIENRIAIYSGLALTAWVAMIVWTTLVLGFRRTSKK